VPDVATDSTIDLNYNSAKAHALSCLLSAFLKRRHCSILLHRLQRSSLICTHCWQVSAQDLHVCKTFHSRSAVCASDTVINSLLTYLLAL